VTNPGAGRRSSREHQFRTSGAAIATLLLRQFYKFGASSVFRGHPFSLAAISV